MTISNETLKARKLFSSRLRNLLIKSDMTQKELAEKLNVTESTVGKWVLGKAMPRTMGLIQTMADYFEVGKSYFLEETTNPLPQAKNVFPIEKKKFPLLGDIACGEPIFADEKHELYVEAGTNIHADFCLRAKGDSMVGARIYDGDIVFIRKQPLVEDGEIAAVIIDDEATLKRVYYDQEAGVLQLFAENPQYKTMRFSGEELNQIRIIGKAVAAQIAVR